MTEADLEERLRADLPALAEVLRNVEAPDPVLVLSDPRRARWGWMAAAVVMLVVAVGGAVLLQRESGVVISNDDPATAVPGRWRPMAEAPIEPRSFATTAWTGDEVVFWAGSSLDRRFAYADGAAYDPATDTWRTMTVPGWGHPGLTSAWFEGVLWLAAKGQAVTLDPVSGATVDLPFVEGLELSTVVATDDAIWGVGSVDSRVAVARYDGEAEQWSDPVPAETTRAELVLGDRLDPIEGGHQIVWTGDEIVVWNAAGVGLALDPATSQWRDLPPIEKSASRSIATAIENQLVVIQWSDGTAALGVLDADAWSWRAVPELDLVESPTLVAAGSQLMVLSADRPPVSVDPATGAALVHDDGPLAGIEGATAAWTGTELVIWGGELSAGVEGAVWTPGG